MPSYKNRGLDLRLNRRGRAPSPAYQQAMGVPPKDAKVLFEEKETCKVTRWTAIHQDERSEAIKQLCGFDLDCAFGPCVGLTRLQRWDRAVRLGLNPPQYIRKLLLNTDGSLNEDIQECLFTRSSD